MKFLFAVAFSLVCFASQAQEQESDVVHKISYQRELPKVASNAMPQGAKSCFFGEFRLREGGEQYALHLFKADSETKMDYTDANSVQQLTLDIFQIGSSSKYKRVNRVPFNYRSLTIGHSKFGCQWLWGDANKQKIPILQFKIWDSEGDDFPGMGDDVFGSFNAGLTHTSTPVIQSFTMGRWIASNASGADNFVKRDANGIARISARIYDPNAFKPPIDNEFKWNGKRFEPTAPIDDQWKNFFHWSN